MGLAADAMKCWEMGDRTGYSEVMAPDAKMVIPAYGLDVSGFDAIWQVRTGMNGRLDTHQLSNLSVKGCTVKGLALVLSKGAVTMTADVTFEFNSKARCVRYHQDVTWMAGQDAATATEPAATATELAATEAPLTIGYWKIRGLAAALRMMCHYKGVPYVNKAYGTDASERWFGRDKPALAQQNALINLPYVVDGETVVTQSNSCLLYLGQRLGIDDPAHFLRNHQALDQAMDLRNDTMKVAYPFAGLVPTAADFPAGLATHLGGAAKAHLAKLEGFCVGPFLCGAAPQSADFAVFEMLDQHVMMAEQAGLPFELGDEHPKLAALHGAMRQLPALAPYFASEPYGRYAVNNPLKAHFVGAGYAAGHTLGATEEATRGAPRSVFVLGGSGMIGSRLAAEARRRGHAVTCASRHGGDVRVDARDAAALGAALRAAAADVVLVALGPSRTDAAAPPLLGTYQAVVEACRAAGARALFVGGAGSLLQSEGGALQVESARFPPEYKDEALQHVEALQWLRGVSDVHWSSLTPPPMIAPGDRTAAFRLGGDVLVGVSISAEDFAVAALDEVEAPRHEGARFAVAYEAASSAA